MQEIVVFVAIVAAILSMTERRPSFEVREPSLPGANINWFNLKVGTEAEMRIKQIYFSIGQEFKDLGWNIPNDCFDRMICLVVLESQVAVESATKGIQEYAITMITQGPVGDLYRECVKRLETGEMEWIRAADEIEVPDQEKSMANCGLMDSIQSSGGRNHSFVIRHQQHPNNVTRTLYTLTKFQ